MTTTETWRFDKNYDNHEQVERFMPAYLAVYAEIAAAGEYPYNDSFRGRVPGIEGPDEDIAIYLLQGLRSLRELEARVAERLADGFEAIESLSTVTKFAGVVHYGYCVGGTGWQEWEDARLVPDVRQGIKAVLPKGKRTHGLLIHGKVLVKRTASAQTGGDK